METEVYFGCRRHAANRQPAEYQETVFVPLSLIGENGNDRYKGVHHLKRSNEPDYHVYYFGNSADETQIEFERVRKEGVMGKAMVDTDLLMMVAKEGEYYCMEKPRGIDSESHAIQTDEYLRMAKELFGSMKLLNQIKS